MYGLGGVVTSLVGRAPLGRLAVVVMCHRSRSSCGESHMKRTRDGRSHMRVAIELVYRVGWVPNRIANCPSRQRIEVKSARHTNPEKSTHSDQDHTVRTFGLSGGSTHSSR